MSLEDVNGYEKIWYNKFIFKIVIIKIFIKSMFKVAIIKIFEKYIIIYFSSYFFYIFIHFTIFCIVYIFFHWKWIFLLYTVYEKIYFLPPILHTSSLIVFFSDFFTIFIILIKNKNLTAHNCIQVSLYFSRFIYQIIINNVLYILLIVMTTWYVQLISWQ